MIFLTETKCKIRLIYVRFNCKRKKWGKKWMEILSIKGGGLMLDGKFYFKLHFVFRNTSLRKNNFCSWQNGIIWITYKYSQCSCHSSHLGLGHIGTLKKIVSDKVLFCGLTITQCLAVWSANHLFLTLGEHGRDHCEELKQKKNSLAEFHTVAGTRSPPL